MDNEDMKELYWSDIDCDLCIMEGRDCVKTVKIEKVDTIYFSPDFVFDRVN